MLVPILAISNASLSVEFQDKVRTGDWCSSGFNFPIYRQILQVHVKRGN